MIVGYAWRKYECGRPVYDFQPPVDERQLILWPAAPGSQLPELNRWEGLRRAFIGFVSLGLAAPHACAYSAATALEVISQEILARTWMEGPDAADAYEYLTGNLLGVWLGDRTPYLITNGPELEEILKIR